MKPKVKMAVLVIKDKTPELKKAIQVMAKSRVLVGVPQDKEARTTGEINNAALAYIHNTGSPAANIPARPFMEPGIQQIQDKIIARMKQLGIAATFGDTQKISGLLHAIGLMAQNSIRSKITEGPFAPLMPSTLRSRLRRGFTGTRPLIVTGQLRQSISYVVEEL